MRRPQFLILVAALLVAADGPKEGAKADLDNIQGSWAVIGLESEGKALPEAALKESRFVVTGDRYTLRGGEDTYQGALRLDPAKKPKTIDATFVDSEGKEKGKAQGIYELTGDHLRICWREKGEGRPAEFVSKPGSGTRLITMKRQKP